MHVIDMVRKLEEAKKHLKRALGALDSAGRWSIVDIISLGGIIPDIFEYSKFSKAKEEVGSAGEIIKDVKAGLGNVGVQAPVIDHTLLWAVFDIGFDGLIIDLLRHSKIKEAKDKVRETIEAVDQLIHKLEG